MVISTLLYVKTNQYIVIYLHHFKEDLADRRQEA
jgi:hypothetical protein